MPLQQEPASKRRRLVLPESLGSDGETFRLSFAEGFASDNESLRLLEVPSTLLGDLAAGDFQSGELRFVGSQEAEADVVLVTDAQTFKLTKVETSNTVLLIPPPSSGSKESNGAAVGFSIAATATYQYEVTKMTPPLDALVRTLGRARYRGRSAEAGIDKSALKACSLQSLESQLTTSRAELNRALRTIGAMLIDGHWRLLDDGYSERMLDAALDFVSLEDVPLDTVDAAAVAEALPQFEPAVLRHVLELASHSNSDDSLTAAGGSSGENGSNGSRKVLALDLHKVAQHRAHQLFRRRKERKEPELWPEDDFMSEWTASVPGVEAPDLAALEGVALRERSEGRGDTGVACLRYVPAAGLPAGAAERLAALFAMRPKWRLPELRPYLVALEAHGTKIEALLLQHTRSSLDPATNERLYSAR